MDDDGTDEALHEIDGRFLVHEILLKGLVILLIEQGACTSDEITAHLRALPDLRQLEQHRPDMLPVFDRLLADFRDRK